MTGLRVSLDLPVVSAAPLLPRLPVNLPYATIEAVAYSGSFVGAWDHNT